MKNSQLDNDWSNNSLILFFIQTKKWLLKIQLYAFFIRNGWKSPVEIILHSDSSDSSDRFVF